MSDLIARLIDATHAVIEANHENLTTLDQAIGDGDHGLNLRRGFQAVAAQRAMLSALEPGPALQKAGMELVMKVGGASGPLYGSLLMQMGKAMPAVPEDTTALADAFAAGIEAVKKRGRSDVGAKTMLDVLVPTLEALRNAASQGLDRETTIARVREVAAASLAATQPMKATKGRASYLGDRSIGHLDPGAQSSALLIGAVCDVVSQGGQA